MLKNSHIVKEAEMKFQASCGSTLSKRLEIMNEMFMFARRFERHSDSPEDSPHVKMLVKLAKNFRDMRTKGSPECLKKPS